MDRRNFLKHVGAGVAGSAALTLGGTVAAQDRRFHAPASQPGLPTVAWRLTTSWTPALDVLQGAAQLLADRVAALTEGRFTIEVFPAGDMVPALDIIDAVGDGTVECGHTASFYFVDKNEVFGLATGLPFGLTPQQHNTWLYYGGGLEAVQQAFGDFGIISFPAGGTGTQMGGWLRREVNTLADLEGFKFRMPGLGGRVMQRLGVETVVVPASEIFDKLDAGEIDGAEWIGPHDDEKLTLHEAAPFYYYPGWWEPGSSLDVLVNRQAWEALPALYREIFTSAAYQVNISVLSQYEVLNQDALVRLLAGGVQLRSYSDEIMEGAKAAAFELYEEIASENADFKAVFEPWKAFRRNIYQWSRFNELSFALFATEHL